MTRQQIIRPGDGFAEGSYQSRCAHGSPMCRACLNADRAAADLEAIKNGKFEVKPKRLSWKR